MGNEILNPTFSKITGHRSHYKISKIVSLLILLLLLFLSVDSYATSRKGFWLGVEGNFGIVTPEADIYWGTDHAVKTTFLYGATITAEFMFKDYLGFSYGLGFLYYTMKIELMDGGVLTTIQYRNFIINSPFIVRFRPMPLLMEDSSFSFFVGVGLDIQAAAFSSRKVIKTASTTTSTSKFKVGYSLITEIGLGYYITADWLLQTRFQYKRALINIDRDDNVKPHIFEFTLGLSYKLF